ncbi:bifunctional hydroxymethylpyrimidine kinase/phosphomethylpyrimidine kinase [Veronia nyctiphanis]|uniref:hydroxymethylpyrimidine kinase n=1 Tax=Veronia nyctiphanis TaxID=1278244 RepID=A0A4Q0YWV6_9GAMM|nr:bifunctional hydroxymethylpyrimidine kinase/phosphomethylpyrimidine kinase [Veronia nyctiphanis]RXJ74774.1 bifunctional hydroxymethylpyrimidine kinase/phosphomethylpyrimidine kinase [Veronia nyctiphanis]
MPSYTRQSLPIVLTIAGSDSGGGAGIQADIKAISATGSYACSVITALTAQNTQGVQGIYPVPIEFINQQLDSVFSDFDIKAVKIGMMADEEIIEAVAKKLHQYQPEIVVLDPVMVATSGDLLLQPSAINALKKHLLPLATVITPNVPEAAALTGVEGQDSQSNEMVAALGELETAAILLKGGHNFHDNQSTDLLLRDGQSTPFIAERIDTQNTHGTGCTLSSALASYLAQGAVLESAVGQAKSYISEAILHADELSVGEGHGPVHHFFALTPHG